MKETDDEKTEKERGGVERGLGGMRGDAKSGASEAAEDSANPQ